MKSEKITRRDLKICGFAIIATVLTLTILTVGFLFTRKIIIAKEVAKEVAVLQADLKDPSSMQICGNIYRIEDAVAQSTVYIVTYNAKNSFGAYQGKKIAEIVVSESVSTFYVTNYNRNFKDFISVEDLARVSSIDGKSVAKKMNCDFIK